MSEVNTLKNKTINGMLWSFLDLFSGRGIQFLTTVILARVLLPEDFGLIAIVLLLIAISNSLIDGGFSQALIREQELSNEDYSTVFYCNVILSFLMYGVLFATAQYVAAFFNQPPLENMIKIFSLVIIVNSFGLVQKARLIKQINFKLQAVINLIAGVVSGIVAVICALTLFGAWSIIIQTMLMQVIQVSLLWLCNRWMPLLRFNFQSLKKLFKFSFQMMISALINTIYNNLFYIIIGKFYPAKQLGYYTNADKLNEMGSVSITTAIQRVSYPMLSLIQNDEHRLKSAFRKTLRSAAYITFPVMIGLAVIADSLIYVLYGSKWLPMAGYFQLLCFIGMLYPLHAIYLNVLQVKGKSNLFLSLEIIKKLLMTILVIVAIWLKLGINGLIGIAFIHSFICLFLNAYFPMKMLSYTVKEHVKDLVPIFIGAFLMGLIVYAISFVLPDNQIIKLACQIGIGILSYISLSKLMKIQELDLFFSIVLSLLPKWQLNKRSKSNIRG